MLSFPPGIQVFMAIAPVDMRKSFDGLSTAVQAVFDRNVLDGHLIFHELFPAAVRLIVMQDATSLPHDVDGCHALIVEQATAIAGLQAAREKQAQELAELNLTIQKLLARLAGHRSERHAEDPHQKQLDFGHDPAVQDGLADAADDAQEILEEYTVRRRRKSRQPRDEKLPEHLERYEVVAPASPAEEQCEQHGPRQIVGYDTTETLEFQRPKLRVKVTKYPKYVCATRHTSWHGCGPIAAWNATEPTCLTSRSRGIAMVRKSFYRTTAARCWAITTSGPRCRCSCKTVACRSTTTKPSS